MKTWEGELGYPRYQDYVVSRDREREKRGVRRELPLPTPHCTSDPCMQTIIPGVTLAYGLRPRLLGKHRKPGEMSDLFLSETLCPV